MKRTVLVFIIGLLYMQGNAQSEDVGMTIEEAFSITLTNNPQITAIQYQELAAAQERKAAVGLRFPQLGVAGTYAHMSDDIGLDFNKVRDGAAEAFHDITDYLESNGIPVLEPIKDAADAAFSKNWGGLTIQDKNFGFVGGIVTLPVYAGGKINVANRAARINENTVKEQGVQAKNALVSELVERYYGASLALSAVKVREQVRDAVKVHLNDAIALEKNGMIARSERLYMEVKMAEAEREVMDAKLQAQTIISALRNTVNAETDITPTSYMFILDDIKSVDYYKQTAKYENPLLKQVELQKDLARENVKLQRAELLPEFALMGTGSFYNYQVSKHIPRWVVGGGVKINIFDGWHKEHKLNSAKSTVYRVEALQQKANNDIGILVEKLYNEMLNYHERMPSIETSLEFAEEYLRVKQAGFKEGVSSSVDVIDAELNLAKTRIEKLQTAYAFDLALAKLLEATGQSRNFLSYKRDKSAVPVMFE